MSDDVFRAVLERENELRRRIKRFGTGLLVGCFEMSFSCHRGGFVFVRNVTGTVVPTGIVTIAGVPAELKSNGWVD